MEQEAKKPLDGIKVVELANYVAAPVCGRMLADMGAEVIKIEGFGGDPWRAVAKANTFTDDLENPIFDIYNAGKKSIRLNIKTGGGQEILHRLLKDADIFLTNTRAKSLKNLGLDYETLKEIYPRLIYVTVNGYGDKGAEAAAPGFDNVAFWTRSGFLMDMSVQSEQSYPVLSPTGSGDTVAGAMLYSGILTALYQRTVTGRGDYVSTALYNTGIWMLASMILQAQDAYGIKFPRTRAESSPFSSPYRCADGEWICITVLDFARFRDVIFRILGIEEEMKRFDVPTIAEMKKNSVEIIPIMEKAFLKKSSAEWLAELKAADVVCGRMTHMNEVSKDPQAIENHFVQEYSFRNGRSCMMPCPPIRLASQPDPLAESAPLAGEDTRQVLLQAGYSEEEIEAFIRSGAVK